MIEPNTLLEQLKRNEGLLKDIATNQVELLAINKKHLSTERYKVAIMGGKFLFFILLTWLSIVFLQNITEDLLGNLTGMNAGNQRLEIDGADDLSQQLRSSQDLMREIMGR